MKRTLVALILLITTWAHAESESIVVDKAGDFSLTPYYLTGATRLTTAAGPMAAYTTTGYGARMGLNPTPEWLKGFSLFVDVNQLQADNDSISSESLSSMSIQYGCAQQLNSFLYVSGAFGTQKVEAENDGLERNLDLRTVGVGLGLSFHVGDSLSIAFEVQHQRGYATKSSARSEDANVGFDATYATIGIRWSPSVSVTFSSK